MFVILVYDVSKDRNNKMLKLCREYLFWIQNSVFHGYISQSNLKKLQERVLKIIDKEEDKVRIYVFDSIKYSRKIDLGLYEDFKNII